MSVVMEEVVVQYLLLEEEEQDERNLEVMAELLLTGHLEFLAAREAR